MKEEIVSFIESQAPGAAAQIGLTGKPLFHERRIPVDFTGMPEQYQRFAVKIPNLPHSIEVRVVYFPIAMAKQFHAGGEWSDFDTVMQIYVPIMEDGSTYPMGYIIGTVEHELTHMVQSWIKGHTKHPRPGYPAESPGDEKYPTGDYSQWGTSQDYLAHGIEFFPQLRDRMHDFMRFPTRTKYDFLYFVTGSVWFKALQDRSPAMYNRAVKELWKMVHDKIEEDPEKETAAKERYDNFMFLKQNKPELMRYAESSMGESFALAHTRGAVTKIITNMAKVFGITLDENSRFEFIPYNENNVTDLVYLPPDGSEPITLISLYKEQPKAQ